MNPAPQALSSFTVGRSSLGGAVILSPSGSLTFVTCPELRTALAQAAEAVRPDIVIDCRQVKAMDSEALELLIEWHGKLREQHGALKLSNLNEVCADILTVTRLVHVLNVHGDVRQAVMSGGT